MSKRGDYCPIGNEPCQSLCDTPCGSFKRVRLTAGEIDEVILAGAYRNPAGGIDPKNIKAFADDVQHALIKKGQP